MSGPGKALSISVKSFPIEPMTSPTIGDIAYNAAMNESVLYTIAEVSITLAGFSGVVVAFRLRGLDSWSPTELRVLWLLIGDSFLTCLFSLLPFPLVLADWSQDAIWGLCNALLGSWYIVGNLLALQGERKEHVSQQLTTVPVITPIFRAIFVIAFAMGIALWMSAWDLVVPRGQAMYVFGLIVLLAFAAVEFVFFIGLMSQQSGKEERRTRTRRSK
jgi:hypothetical protein